MKIVTFLEVLKKKFRNLAASHRTWNVTFCDENVTSLHFVSITHSKPGLGPENFLVMNDPEVWHAALLRAMPHSYVTCSYSFILVCSWKIDV